MLWIVAVMNMVNFLDGLDGLAAGVCAIAGVTFAVIALSLGKTDAAILSAIVAGACLGFLRHNFFPARIFMGDSGALLLGFLLAAVSVQGLLKTASTVVLFLPLLVLAVPILDTSFVVARRLKHRQPVYVSDQAHLHFRFLRRGFSQRRAAVTMWAWCVTLAGAALATRFVPFREGGEWHLGDARRRRDRARRARLLAVRRLPAGDRQAERTRAASGGAQEPAAEFRPPLGLQELRQSRLHFRKTGGSCGCHISGSTLALALLCSPPTWSPASPPSIRTPVSASRGPAPS